MTPPSTPTPADLPEVTISEQGSLRFLHLGSEWVQGSMRLRAPFAIELDYVQRMLAWLLFVEADSLAQRHAMQLGLGAAALTKFCYKKLDMECTAVEINPQVLAACRAWFKLPPEGPRLRVLLADAGAAIRQPEHAATVDALQVDLYDQHAAAPVQDSATFYADCRALLRADGGMTVNLFGRDARFEHSLQRIVSAFGAHAVWAFPPTREGNTVVLALRQATRPTHAQWQVRAATVQARWGLPAPQWLPLLKPIVE